ncbi:hypothetical protein KY308_02380 [Candidatus Woesearchaeota archaeon]|nr:hypothetical protein [Candidatus Woesearchaeota archaeon]
MVNLKVLKSWRVVLLIIFLILSLVALYPNPYSEGVAIRGVIKDGPAYLGGVESPKATAAPMTREVIKSINNIEIKNLEDYSSALSTLLPNITVQLKTNKKTYRIIPQYRFEIVTLENETTYENRTKEFFNETLNQTVNITEQVEVPKRVKRYFENDSLDLGLSVYNAPKSNLRLGLDLQGGTRVLLQPAEVATKDQMDNIIQSMEQRLNVYGISDVIIRPVSDLEGNEFIRVEIAGVTEQEVKDLVTSQGKFEAKITNITVFRGGTDITYVCRSAECSGIDPQQGCGRGEDGQWYCRFRFAIAITPEAAQRQADATKDLLVIEDYLNESIDFYLDDQPVDSLHIGADLKGRAVTDIQISGSGAGPTQEAAVNDALQNMKRLQTIIITGSLPIKLNVVKMDTISPTLGKEFSKSIFIMSIIAILAVVGVIFIKYREIKITIPIAISVISEVVIILGIAALIGWNIDLAAIAGIIVAVGTGVDDQIVITDETLRGESSGSSNWRERFKRAFFIIMAAYVTTVVAMIPLLFAGAGLLKGFAITSILGVSIGVFITRPAYAAIVEQILKGKY